MNLPTAPNSPAADATPLPELAGLVDTVKRGQIEFIETIGAIKAFEVNRRFNSVATLKSLAALKQTKSYKGMEVLVQGQVLRLKTWADVCGVLGLSVDKVDEDIKNLDLFGEAFLEGSRRLGLGYRDIRRLRALPEGDRIAVVQEVEADIASDDKEGILALIDNLSARHASKEREWEATREELEKRADKSEARVHAAVEVETKALTKERNQLIKERDALAAQLEDPTWQASRAMAAVIVERAEDITRMVTQLLKTLPTDEPPIDLAQSMEIAMYRMQQAGNVCFERWTSRAEQFEFALPAVPGWARNMADAESDAE